MTETEFRERLSRLEEQVRFVSEQQGEMKPMLGELVADLHERRGREAILRVTHVEDREDKFQFYQWVRAFLPSGIFTAFWLALIEVIRRMTSAPQ